jgi:hypothetical protein
MNRRLIASFVKRLKRIGVEVELVANYPWVYMTKVNGVPVTELFMANHGFTAFFVHRGDKWSDRREVFAKIRELLSRT